MYWAMELDLSYIQFLSNPFNSKKHNMLYQYVYTRVKSFKTYVPTMVTGTIKSEAYGRMFII